MDKKSHIKIASVTFSSLFPFYGTLKRYAYIYGSVEPDLNVFTYLRGHGEKRVRAYILEELNRLSRKQYWSILDFYKAGRISHYIVDSFTLPHTRMFKGNIKEHIAWEKTLARKVMGENEFPVRRDIGFTLDEIKERYLSAKASIENDILFSISALFRLLQRAFTPELAIQFSLEKASIR